MEGDRGRYRVLEPHEKKEVALALILTLNLTLNLSLTLP